MADFEIKNGVAVIPEGTTTIGEGAFRGFSSLQSITIPEGVTEIDDTSFDECEALTTIYVPAKKTDYYMQRLPEKLHSLIVEL